jgi:hypothetical protein
LHAGEPKHTLQFPIAFFGRAHHGGAFPIIRRQGSEAFQDCAYDD